MCNRIIVINLGNILFDGTPEQVVQTAKGHTGSLMEHEIAGAAGDYEITSRISTSDGVVCRIVGYRAAGYCAAGRTHAGGRVHLSDPQEGRRA